MRLSIRVSSRTKEAVVSFLRDKLSTEDLRQLRFATKINIFGLGLLALWTAINTILLPGRIEETAPSALRGSALGLISLVGVGIAALVQPFAGRVSDAAQLPDRRRPFIAGGTVLAVLALVLFGWAPVFLWLLLGFVVLQVAANIGQAAFQAFIPDLVEEPQRGLASGVKNALTVAGAAIGLLGVRLVQLAGYGTGAALAFLAVLLLTTAILTVVWVPRVPPDPDYDGGLGAALSPRAVWASFTTIMHEHPVFRLAVVAQFLVLLGTNPAQRFLLYFLRDRFGRGAEERASLGLVVAIVLAALAAVAAGKVSDHLGRRPVLIVSVVLVGVGTVGIGIAPTLPLVSVAGALIAVGLGAFQAVNWALLNDDIPEGEAAAAFGLANVATAGAGAVAGLFGPLVDGLDAVLSAGTYGITFSLAGLVALAALLPLRRVHDASAPASEHDPS